MPISLTKNKEAPSAPKKEWNKGAVAQLILKQGATPATSKGIKVFMVDENGKPKYYDSTLLLFKSQLDLLLSGQAREVPLFIGEPSERKAKEE